MVTGPIVRPGEPAMLVRPSVGHLIEGGMAVAVYELVD